MKKKLQIIEKLNHFNYFMGMKYSNVYSNPLHTYMIYHKVYIYNPSELREFYEYVI